MLHGITILQFFILDNPYTLQVQVPGNVTGTESPGPGSSQNQFTDSCINSEKALERDVRLMVPRNVQLQKVCEHNHPRTCDHACQSPTFTSEY